MIASLTATPIASLYRCWPLLLSIAFALGCGSQPPVSKPTAIPPGDKEATDPSAVDPPTHDEAGVELQPPSEQELAAIRQAVEQCGGLLTCTPDGLPVEIDLVAGRASANAAAFDAVIACPALKTLRIRAGQIPADRLSRLDALVSLSELMLQDSALTDDILETLAGKLRALKRLTLRNAFDVTDDGLASLGQLSELTHLALIDMQITGVSLDTVAALPSLVSLDLRMCNSVQSGDLTKLADAPKLKELKLAGYGVDDQAMAVVAVLPDLESLTVEDASMGAQGLAAIGEQKQMADRIRALSFARCSGLTDDALEPLRNFVNLQRLALRDVPVSGGFLQHLPSPQSLELLSLNQTFLTDESFASIAACGNLKRLELAQSFLSALAVEQIATLTGLEYLNVADCGLDDETIQPLTRLKKLRTLMVEGNPGVSPETVAEILGRHPN